MSRDRYLFYTACTRPLERLYLVREAATDDGNPREPSPFWDEVQSAFDPDDVRRWTRRRPLSALTWSLDDAPTDRERLRALAELAARDRASADALARANAWERRLERALGAFERPTRLTHPLVLEQLEAKTTFNVTELERFADCSSAWFVERFLGPRTIDAEVDAKLRGSVAHNALYKFFTRLPKELGVERLDERVVEDAVRLMRACLDEAVQGVRMDMTEMQARELDSTLWRDLEAVVRAECESELTLVPRRFEVLFGGERAAPELQRGLDLGDGLTLSGKIDRIDQDPFGARGIVQDYKSGKHAHSAREIESELRLQIPLYMLVLRDLVGLEPLGGLYRPLAGERKARGLLRASEGRDAEGLLAQRLSRGRGVLGRGRPRARDRAHARAAHPRRRRRARPEGRRVPDVVRPLADVPGAAGMNEQQRAAVEATGEVFVSAGAGTGKTAVLVERFVRAVCERGLDVDSILVITYTRRAAGELRTRIRAALAERGRHDLARELDGAWISTIHGFCLRLLKAYPFAAGLDPRFRELDDAQGSVLRSEAFRQALDEFCADGDPDRLRLLATYGADGLRRMLTGVYETLRSAGRELSLEIGGRADLAERVDDLREAARCLVDDAARDRQPALGGDAAARAPRARHARRPADGAHAAFARRASAPRRTRRRARRPSTPRSTRRRRATARFCRSCSSGSPRRTARRRRASRRSTSRICSSTRATCCATTRRSASARGCASARSWSTSSRTRTACSAISSISCAGRTQRCSSSATSSSRSTASGTPTSASSASGARSRRSCCR